MPISDLQAAILDQDLCTSCGACVAVCPLSLLSITTENPQPRMIGEISPDACGSCNLCFEVCPGKETAVDESERRLFERTRSDDERWTGIIRETFVAKATEPEVSAAASAGGAATSLLVTALRNGTIEGAIVIGRDDDQPWIPRARIATSEQEIIDSAQATYCVTPNLQLLQGTDLERIGFVGLPCQIQAIEKMRSNAQGSAVAAKVALTIEIACSSHTLLRGTEYLIEDRLRLPLIAVSKMKYRDGTYPGEFTVRENDGTRHALPFHELVTEFTKFKTFRCKACPDWWSGLADVSIADGDPNIFQTSRDGTPAEKASMVVTRTALGSDLLRIAIDQGAIDARPEMFDPDESLGLQRKRHRYAKFADENPGRVPVSRAVDTRLTAALDDDEVIRRMG